MAEKAEVRSLEAIEAFRSRLIVYVSQARPALEEASAEVTRVRSWLEGEQRAHWENQIRRRTKELDQARQALFSGRLGMLRREGSAEQLAFHRAKRELEEAEGKLRAVKRWAREFENRVQPLLKQTEKLHTVLAHDMVNAVGYLTQAINTLAAYAETTPAPVENATQRPVAEPPPTSPGVVPEKRQP
ncbi:MAG TPA: hypothetical protein VJA21_29175 [Verrucomicrobiae bacterium]